MHIIKSVKVMCIPLIFFKMLEEYELMLNKHKAITINNTIFALNELVVSNR